MNAYDALRYPSRSYAQTHPDRLATQAILMGMQPAPAADCRVLEIGCGDGTNLLAMAAELPGSRFVGVDLAGLAIAEAENAAAELGLVNAVFHAADVATLPRGTFGPFDYIIAHGVFSWVDEPVRQRILALCRETLSPVGVAYVSYNAYPGCHLRDLNRRMMRYHVRHVTAPVERIAQGRALLNLLVNGRRPTDDAYHRALEEGLEHALDYHESAFFHDDLSATNQPYYFYEFMDLAAAHGMQFLAEAELRDMHPSGDEPAVVELLNQLGEHDVLEREQYLDFLTGRRFRQTLLCRSDVVLERGLVPARLKPLRVAAQIEPEDSPADALATGVSYRGPRGSTLTTEHPAIMTVLSTLANAWPQSVDYAELTTGGGAGAELNVLADFLLDAAKGGVIELRASPSPLVRRTGGRPEASRFARWQSRREKSLTTLHHSRVRIEDDSTRALLALMDGTRDRLALVAALADEMAASGASPAADGDVPVGRVGLADGLTGSLEDLLDGLGRMGLLRA